MADITDAATPTEPPPTATRAVPTDISLTTPQLSGGGSAVRPGAPPAPPGFEILGELGRGGMGVVYHARQTKLNREVALKMILAGGHAGEHERARFLAEAESIAALNH